MSDVHCRSDLCHPPLLSAVIGNGTVWHCALSSTLKSSIVQCVMVEGSLLGNCTWLGPDCTDCIWQIQHIFRIGQ